MAGENVGLSTAEAMAVAVLRGDMEQTRLLADHVLLDCYGGGRQSKRIVPHVRKITTDVSRLRAIVYLKDGPHRQYDEIRRVNEVWRQVWARWLADTTQPLVVSGVDRVEIYELPPLEDEVPELATEGETDEQAERLAEEDWGQL